MAIYIAVVQQDEGSAYGVQFPDLPAVHSAADDQADVLASAQEALALYFEDADPVEARDLAAIARDPEVAAMLADGAYLLAVPVIHLDGRSTKANLTFDHGLLRQIDATAKQRGMTRSAYLAGLAQRDIMGV
ncbi:MAG: type II toxin-antitoxin system HicB family antitoxin [Pseudomonadota bacterium]